MPNPTIPNHERISVEAELRESMEQTAEELIASMNGGELSESAKHQAHAVVELAIGMLNPIPAESPAPMTQSEAIAASVEAFDGERRNQAVSHARHCIDSTLEELRKVAMGDALTPERAFLLVVALESAGEHLEDVLEGLYG